MLHLVLMVRTVAKYLEEPCILRLSHVESLLAGGERWRRCATILLVLSPTSFFDASMLLFNMKGSEGGARETCQ